jgi:hypothetical protein
MVLLSAQKYTDPENIIAIGSKRPSTLSYLKSKSVELKSLVKDRHLLGRQLHSHLLPSYPALACLDHRFSGRAHAALNAQITLVAALLAHSSSGVSICAFVPVKQVN